MLEDRQKQDKGKELRESGSTCPCTCANGYWQDVLSRDPNCPVHGKPQHYCDHDKYYCDKNRGTDACMALPKPQEKGVQWKLQRVCEDGPYEWTPVKPQDKGGGTPPPHPGGEGE